MLFGIAILLGASLAPVLGRPSPQSTAIPVAQDLRTKSNSSISASNSLQNRPPTRCYVLFPPATQAGGAINICSTLFEEWLATLPPDPIQLTYTPDQEGLMRFTGTWPFHRYFQPFPRNGWTPFCVISIIRGYPPPENGTTTRTAIAEAGHRILNDCFRERNEYGAFQLVESEAIMLQIKGGFIPVRGLGEESNVTEVASS